jgi:hypothetical protein
MCFGVTCDRREYGAYLHGVGPYRLDVGVGRLACRHDVGLHGVDPCRPDVCVGPCRLGVGLCRLGAYPCRHGVCRLAAGPCRLGVGPCRLGPCRLGASRLGDGPCLHDGVYGHLLFSPFSQVLELQLLRLLLSREKSI